MAAPENVQENRTFTLIESPIVPIDTVIDLESIDAVKPHIFAGIQFFADAQGSAQAIPDAGSVMLTIETVNSSPTLEAPLNNFIDATNIKTADWAANTRRVVATPIGITVATHYRLVVTCNET